MTNAVLRSAAILALMLVGGCATIASGTTQVVTIDSNVPGADVAVNGMPVGRTPYTGPIKRGSTTTVSVTNGGYQPKTITLSTEVEPIFWGNIILGGFFGSTTDAGTGAMYKYAPATYQLALVPIAGPPVAAFTDVPPATANPAATAPAPAGVTPGK
jgi:hypothetical protein